MDMIPLDDPIWDQLSCHNISGREFAGILGQYHAGSIPMDEDLWEDLYECICGGDVYDSSLAAAPHLIQLSSRCGSSAAAIMLQVAAMAIAEAAREGDQFDPRLTAPLREAARAGEIEAMRVLESPELDQKAREEMELSLLAFSGDTSGYWQSHEKMWAECPAAVTVHHPPPPRIEVNWGSDQSSSYTFSSGQ
jgi:hypothetical protein